MAEDSREEEAHGLMAYAASRNVGRGRLRGLGLFSGLGMFRGLGAVPSPVGFANFADYQNAVIASFPPCPPPFDPACEGPRSAAISDALNQWASNAADCRNVVCDSSGQPAVAYQPYTTPQGQPSTAVGIDTTSGFVPLTNISPLPAAPVTPVSTPRPSPQNPTAPTPLNPATPVVTVNPVTVNPNTGNAGPSNTAVTPAPGSGDGLDFLGSTGSYLQTQVPIGSQSFPLWLVGIAVLGVGLFVVGKAK